MRPASLIKALPVCALALAFSADAPPASAEDARPNALRLCADPSNLPFSSDDPAAPGLYLEIGDAIARALGRPVDHVWYRTYFGKRAVRTTMLAKQCDAMIGLPETDDFMGPKVIFSKPMFDIGYAIVAPKGQGLASVDDLKGKRVAVQFETEPQNIVAPREDMTAVTVLSPEEGMQALADGRADAAFVWAPNAGYLNKTAYGGRFAIVLVDGRGLSFPAAIGYAKGSKELRDAIDAVLPEVAQQFPALFAKYGFAPERAPPPIDSADKPAVLEKATMLVAQTEQSPAPAQAEQPAQTATAKDTGPPAGDGAGEFDVAPALPPPTPEMIAEGKETFNGTCAHCHGPDAVQSVKKIDLRRLKLRYGDGALNMFWKTVHEGRPAKGMPTWKGVFSDEQFQQIYAYLATVQSKE